MTVQEEKVFFICTHAEDNPEKAAIPFVIGAPRRRKMFRQFVSGVVMPDYEFAYSDFIEVPPGVYVPKKFVTTGYGKWSDPPEWWGKATLRNTVTVSQIALNQLNDDDFRLHLPAGTLVYSEDNQTFVVPGERSTERIDQLVQRFPPVARPGLSRRAQLWIGLNAGVVAILVAFKLWKRRRSQPA